MGAPFGHSARAALTRSHRIKAAPRVQMSVEALTRVAPSRTFADDGSHERLPRLLKGVSTAEAITLLEHERIHGPLPPARGRRPQVDIIELVQEAGLRGRGGGGFPTARKMRAVGSSRRRPVVVVNAVEGEPASFKDRSLMTRAPHLVLDGANLAARALGADEVLVAVGQSARASFESGARAIVERCNER